MISKAQGGRHHSSLVTQSMLPDKSEAIQDTQDQGNPPPPKVSRHTPCAQRHRFYRASLFGAKRELSKLVVPESLMSSVEPLTHLRTLLSTKRRRVLPRPLQASPQPRRLTDP